MGEVVVSPRSVQWPQGERRKGGEGDLLLLFLGCPPPCSATKKA